MEKPHLYRSDLLLPVQLRQDGLVDRLVDLDQQVTNISENLPDDIRMQIERVLLQRGLDAVQRSFEAIVKMLCLNIDGSMPDDEKWYANAVHQLAGHGAGRVTILPPDLVRILLFFGDDPECGTTLGLDDILQQHQRRWQVGLTVATMLVNSCHQLDESIADGTISSAGASDPDFLMHHSDRQNRAAARARALTCAFIDIEAAFVALGYRVIPFGSVVEGRVHDRSDLDLIVPGKITWEEEKQLWHVAQNIARAANIVLDLKFEAVCGPGLLDQLKVIRDGQIMSLRQIVDAT